MEIMEFLEIGSAISTPNSRISEISRNSTFPGIRARASGSGPTRQNLSPDLRLWARAGRAAISIPTHLFYENHEILGNPLGYIHSNLKDFQISRNSTFPGIRAQASDSEPTRQILSPDLSI